MMLTEIYYICICNGILLPIHSTHQMTNQLFPHNNSAAYYDVVYSEMNAYTPQTIAAINYFQPQGTIIDFGAGTGRLTIPLAQMKYSMIAVEQSSEMCGVLRSKMAKNELQFPIHNCSIEQYKGAPCNMAIALFTVFIYCLNEEQLQAQIHTICAHIKPGGFFFFDIPHQSLFEGQTRSLQGIKKHIRIDPSKHKDIFDYYEHCVSTRKKAAFDYEEHFQIRYWSPEIFNRILTDCNMEFVTTLAEFDDMGADYCMWRKKK